MVSNNDNVGGLGSSSDFWKNATKARLDKTRRHGKPYAHIEVLPH